MFCTNCGQEIANNAAICVNCGVAVGQEKKFCGNCGKPVNANQAMCLGCGVLLQQNPGGSVNAAQANAQANSQASEQAKTVHPSGKSASIAVILSCLIPGLGQIYLGQTLKGVVILGTFLVTCLLFLWIIPWIIAMIDASKIGKKLEAGQSVGEWEFF